MNIEVKIEDYLNKEEIKEIVAEEIKKHVRSVVGNISVGSDRSSVLITQLAKNLAKEGVQELIPTFKKLLNERIKIEVINEKDLSKYLKLAFDTQQAHKPFAMGILLIAIDEDTAIVKVVRPENVVSKEFAELFKNKMSMRTLFAEIEEYKKFLSTV